MAKIYSLDDREQLHKDANQALDENLAPNEPVKIIIRGSYNSSIIGTERRAFVFKKGFMGGATFGKKFTSWNYQNITGIQIETGMFGGFVAIMAPGVESADMHSWGRGKKDPSKSPNAIHINEFEQARKGVALMRQLISESQMQGSPANVSTSQDIPGKIKQLAELHEQGILTAEEFQAKKSELLARI